MSSSDASGDDAIVLHARPFRESSQLVELLLRGAGRQPAIVRGARRADRRGNNRALAPFCHYQIELRGHGEVLGVRRAEACRRHDLAREHLIAGFYINELLLALLHRHAPVPALFDAVLATYAALAAGLDLEPVLRTFELGLLRELGVGLDLERDEGGAPIVAERCYAFRAEQGWVPAEAGGEGVLSGRQVLALSQLDFREAETRKGARRLLRAEIDRLLAGRPLRSRELFRAQRRGSASERAAGPATSASPFRSTE